MKLYKKLFTSLVMFIAFTTVVLADNKFVIDDFSIKPGETKTIEVKIATTDAIDCHQMYVFLPEGLSFAGTNGNWAYGSCVDGKNTATMQSNGSLFINGYGCDIKPQNNSIFVTFDVTASSDFEGGNISVKDVILGEYDQDDFTVKVTAESEEPVVGNNFVIKGFNVAPGKTAKVEVLIATTDAIDCHQMYVFLPEGLSFAGTDGNWIYGSCVDGKNTATMQSNGSLFINGYGCNIQPQNNSVFVTFEVTASNDFKGGNIEVKDVILGEYDQDNFTVTVTADSTDGINNAIVNIENNAVVYNIAGQRVNANAKGIIIKNGKKFIAQ